MIEERYRYIEKRGRYSRNILFVYYPFFKQAPYDSVDINNRLKYDFYWNHILEHPAVFRSRKEQYLFFTIKKIRR